MEYIKLSFPSTDEQVREMLIASLAEIDFEGFEEDPDQLHAYIPEDKLDTPALAALSERFGISFQQQNIPPQNWNEQWESGFQPVIVPGFCTVRAGFHQMPVTTPYEVIITPKMSFGTGHHATTQLMMEQMRTCDLQGKYVLDYGTGTGLLAILAAKLGAAKVTGIDNDEWSFENAREHIVVNDCDQVSILLGSLDLTPEDAGYDLILANINRHILIASMQGLYQRIKAGGQLLMSGLLQEDFDIIHKTAAEQGFVLQNRDVRDNWIVLDYKKPVDTE